MKIFTKQSDKKSSEKSDMLQRHRQPKQRRI